MKCSHCGCSVLEVSGNRYECTNCMHTWELDAAMIQEITDLIKEVEDANNQTSSDTAIL